jgi:hypothetical protein
MTGLRIQDQKDDDFRTKTSGLSPEAGSAARLTLGSMKNDEEWPPSPRAATAENRRNGLL